MILYSRLRCNITRHSTTRHTTPRHDNTTRSVTFGPGRVALHIQAFMYAQLVIGIIYPIHCTYRKSARLIYVVTVCQIFFLYGDPSRKKIQRKNFHEPSAGLLQILIGTPRGTICRNIARDNFIGRSRGTILCNVTFYFRYRHIARDNFLWTIFHVLVIE